MWQGPSAGGLRERSIDKIEELRFHIWEIVALKHFDQRSLEFFHHLDLISANR